MSKNKSSQAKSPTRKNSKVSSPKPKSPTFEKSSTRENYTSISEKDCKYIVYALPFFARALIEENIHAIIYEGYNFQDYLKNTEQLATSTGLSKEFENFKPLYFRNMNIDYQGINAEYFLFKNAAKINDFESDFNRINSYFDDKSGIFLSDYIVFENQADTLFLTLFESFIKKNFGYQDINLTEISFITEKKSGLMFSVRMHDFYFGKYGSGYNKIYKKYFDENIKGWLW